MEGNPPYGTEVVGRGKRQTGPGVLSLQWRQQARSPDARAMPSCVACGVGLEPPVPVAHAVYVNTFYRIAGQDYCRHHIIRAAVVAGIIYVSRSRWSNHPTTAITQQVGSACPSSNGPGISPRHVSEAATAVKSTASPSCSIQTDATDLQSVAISSSWSPTDAVCRTRRFGDGYYIELGDG